MGSSFFYQVIGALLMGLVSSLALAEQQGAPSLRVDSLNKEIEAESARLKELYASQDTLETQLSKLNVLLGDLETKQRVASAELGALVRQRDTLHAELESVGVEIEKTNTLLRRRVRIMYMLSQHRDRVLSLVFRDGDQPGRTLYFLSKVQNFDQMLLGAQQALAKELSGKQATLRDVVARQTLVADDLGAQRQAVAQQKVEKQTVLQNIATQREQLEGSITSLKAKALRLETVVSSITLNPAAAPDLRPAKTQSQKSAVVEGFHGQGLIRLRGRLPAPVQGTVMRGFGKHKHPEFADLVFIKGLEYKVTPGAPVRAVAAGKVIYSGRLPGYGTLLIVDHGDRTHTLYARLSDIAVEQGTIVNAGDELAATAPLDSRERNFYFEIRVRGKPVNPAGFLR